MEKACHRTVSVSSLVKIVQATRFVSCNGFEFYTLRHFCCLFLSFACSLRCQTEGSSDDHYLHTCIHHFRFWNSRRSCFHSVTQISPLNLLAFSNIRLMLFTLDTSHFEMSPLKEMVCVNMKYARYYVTLRNATIKLLHTTEQYVHVSHT